MLKMVFFFMITAATFLSYGQEVSGIPVFDKEYVMLEWNSNLETSIYEMPRMFSVDYTSEWKFFVFLLIAFLLAFIRMQSRMVLREFTNALFSYNLACQIIREEEAKTNLTSIILNLVFFLVFAMLIYFVVIQSGMILPLSGIYLYGVIFLVIVLLNLVKEIIYGVLGEIFSFGKEIQAFNFHTGLILKTAGIYLFPVILLYAYVPQELQNAVFMVLILIMGLVLILRALRGIKLAAGYVRLYKFHLMLYICTLEIAPLIILIKLLKNQINF